MHYTELVWSLFVYCFNNHCKILNNFEDQVCGKKRFNVYTLLHLGTVNTYKNWMNSETLQFKTCVRACAWFCVCVRACACVISHVNLGVPELLTGCISMGPCWAILICIRLIFKGPCSWKLSYVSVRVVCGTVRVPSGWSHYLLSTGYQQITTTFLEWNRTPRWIK